MHNKSEKGLHNSDDAVFSLKLLKILGGISIVILKVQNTYHNAIINSDNTNKLKKILQ